MNPASGGAGSDCETGTILESWLFGYDGDGVRVSTAHFTGGTADSLSLYYFGGSYEVTDGAVKKYYSFAGQTIAMKDDAGLKYFLTDHLGSIVSVLDASGNVLSEQRYLPFGGVREDLPIAYRISQTDFGYTGQRSLGGELGLMDYRARFYDPYLSRFIQPDTLIPGADNPQAWNRYSYVLNQPIALNDPSGHCPNWFVILGGPSAAVWCGILPDYRGIARSIWFTDDTRVAAALAVQSQWLAPWDSHLAYPALWAKAKLTGGESPYYSSGFGLGQISDAEMEKFELIPVTQDLPWVAAKAMEMRIDDVLEACEEFNCSAEDKFIATALAQNGGFTRRNFIDLLNAADDGGINWESYFSDREKSGGDGGVLDFRAEDVGEGRGGFATRFMLRLYINDTLALESLGYELPYGLTRNQLIGIRDKYASIR